MTVFYFTATGNSLAVAKHIGGNLISIPQVIDSENLHYKDDAIGIVFPVFWWSTPIMVRQFLDKVSFETDYLFAIGTCGNVIGGAMTDLHKQVKRKGYSFSYTNHILMLDNYIPVFDMDSQLKKLPKKYVDESIAQIVTDIGNRTQKKAKAHFGKRAMTALFRQIFRPEKNAQKYIVTSSCNSCGVCSKVCPAKNITVTSKVSFDNHCEGCLACLHLCPQNALHLKSEKSNTRWLNPEVTPDEIIKANNRM